LGFAAAHPFGYAQGRLCSSHKNKNVAKVGTQRFIEPRIGSTVDDWHRAKKNPSLKAGLPELS
jgi:hypothetical protein